MNDDQVNNQIGINKDEISALKRQVTKLTESIEGRLVVNNYKEIRVFNSVNRQGDIDDGSPIYIYINIPSNVSKIIAIDFILNIVTGTPSIKLYVSENNGFQYSDGIGPFTAYTNYSIKDYFTCNGNKLLKIESDAEATIDIQTLFIMNMKTR